MKENINISPDILREKERSLRLYQEALKARGNFYANEFLMMNLGGGDESNFSQQLEAAQENYTKNYKNLNRLEKSLDKERLIMLESINNYEDLLGVALWEMSEYNLDSMASFPIFSSGQ